MAQDYERMDIEQLKKIYRENHKTITNRIHKKVCQVPMRKSKLIETLRFQEGLLDLLELKNKLKGSLLIGVA